MEAIAEGTALLFGTLITQLVVLFGIVYAAHNAREAREVAKTTLDSVNNVDHEAGEMKLIDQVRMHGRQLQRHDEYHRWTADTLGSIADEIGVKVSPLPEFDSEGDAA